MTQSPVDKVVEAVLYEGYVLYPYRPSVKNRQRWTFGGLYPRAYAETRTGSDAWQTQTQCLLIGEDTSTVRVTIRFLHLTNRTSPHSPDPWQEGTERTVDIATTPLTDLLAAPIHRNFGFPASCDATGDITRERQSVEGTAYLSADRIRPGHFRLTVRISNTTALAPNSPPSRDDALMRSLASTHAILTTTGGRFISMTDPPDDLREAASDCRNVGTWPVLVGDPGQADTMLASPIILYDYPQIAPESPGDLFDATEIDEILSLRILTLTDDEKKQAAAVDPRVDALLARTESLAREQLMNLHGTVRGLRPIPPGEQHA